MNERMNELPGLFFVCTSIQSVQFLMYFIKIIFVVKIKFCVMRSLIFS